MKVINLSITTSQLLVLSFVIILLLILVVAIVSLVRGILDRRKMTGTALPDIDGLGDEPKEREKTEIVDEGSFFDLDSLEEDFTDDMASYKIMKDAKKLQDSPRTSNPFRRM